jgi:hypothetical protein
MKARREEEAIIADGPRERGGLVQAGTGPMQGHSWLDVELRRVFNLAQSVPCLKRKAKKMVCCAIK